MAHMAYMPVGTPPVDDGPEAGPPLSAAAVINVDASADVAALLGGARAPGMRPWRDSLPIKFRLAVLSAALLLASALASVTVSLRGRQDPGRAASPTSQAAALALWDDTVGCDTQESDADYWTDNHLYRRTVLSADECQTECRTDPKCDVWMWGASRGQVGLSDVCFLRALGDDQLRPKVVEREGVISGFLCRTHSNLASEDSSSKGSDLGAGGGIKATGGEDGAQDVLVCGTIYTRMDLLTEKVFYKIYPVADAESCRTRCEEMPECELWSWGKTSTMFALDDVCYLKRLKEGEQPELQSTPGMSSGVACRSVRSFGSGSTTTSAASTTEESTTRMPCGEMQNDVLVKTGSTLVKLGGIGGAHGCEEFCLDNTQCRVWTWTAGDCILMELASGEQPKRFRSTGTVSGVLCRQAEEDRAPDGGSPMDAPVHAKSLELGAKIKVVSTSGDIRSGTVTDVDWANVRVHYDGLGSDWDEWLLRTSYRIIAILTTTTTTTSSWADAGATHAVSSTTEPRSSGTTTTATRTADGKTTTAEADDGKAASSSTTAASTTTEASTTTREGDAREVSTTTQAATTAVPLNKTCFSTHWHDTDIMTSAPLLTLQSINSPSACQEKCSSSEKCGAWTWGAVRGVPGLSDVCFLKVVAAGEIPKRVDKPGVVSGELCGVDPAAADPLVHRFPDNFPPGSLFCYALVQPMGYERGLVAWQYKEKASLFACEEYAVYSNQVMQITPGLYTSVVQSDLKCDYGGEFQTALNTEIFFAVWNKVYEDGRYKLHDWTIKVDPDTVFLPQRLRHALDGLKPGVRGMYINNCKMGLHGPLEVFSRQAIEEWRAGRDTCVKYFNKLCSGDCMWGEDMFIDQCLERVLKVDRHDDYNILVEDHCAPPSGWGDCRDTSFAAFHPFKAQDGYERCLGATRAAEGDASHAGGKSTEERSLPS